MSDPPSGRRIVPRDLALVALLTGLLFTVALGARDLWNPNEPIYGRAVVEMLQRGDALIPSVNGLPFAEKPILYYWLALAAAKLGGGADETTLRLPAAAAGTASALLLYLLVQPYAGAGRARLAVALHATTYGVFWEARAVQMDILVLLSTLGVVLAVTRVVDHGFGPWPGWALAGLAAGLGFLAKGPVAWICPGITLLAWLALRRRLVVLRSPAVVLGALVCLATLAVWVVPLYLRDELSFLHEALLRQNFARFVDAWDHDRPWWYYLRYFWIVFVPWSWFVPLAARRGNPEEPERALDRLAWCWIVGLVLFFSLSDSKRSPYILPAAPAVAVLVSGVGRRLLDGTLQRRRRLAALAVCGLYGLLALAGAELVLLRVPADHPAIAVPSRALALVLAAGGAAILGGLATKRRDVAAPTALFALVLTIYGVAAVWLLPAADAYKSARPFCERVQALAGADAELRSYRFWRWRAEYVHYLDRRIPVLSDEAALREYWGRPHEVYLIVENVQLAAARDVIGDVEPLVARPIGSRTAYLFSNRRPS